MVVDSCILGDALEVLPGLVEAGLKVQCVVTSPPYWGLRDYGGLEGQIGLEETPEAHLERLIKVFGLVRDLLAEDGTLWLNYGDCYNRKNLLGMGWRLALALQAAGWILRSAIVWAKPNPMPESVTDRPTRSYEHIFLLSKSERYFYDTEAAREPAAAQNTHDHTGQGYAAPGQPSHRGNRPPHPRALSFARHVNEPERPDGSRPNHRPDRAKKGETWKKTESQHRYSGRRDSQNDFGHLDRGKKVRKYHTLRPGIDTKGGAQGAGYIEFSPYDRNWRDVWTIPVQPFSGAHFATFPEALVRRCILAGSRPDDLVLDPFMGSGTVAVVAEKLGRKWLGIELNEEYLEIQGRRLATVNPLFKAAGL